MGLRFGLSVLIFLSALKAQPPTVAGDWSGVLDFGQARLRLVLHVTGTPRAYKATADSPDQGAAGIPVDEAILNGTTFRFAIQQVGASFEGTVNPDGSEISGKFSQGSANVPLVLKRVAATAAAKLAGAWGGTLEVPGGQKLRLVLNVSVAPDGAVSAKLDSPDQGAFGIPVDEIALEGQKLRWTLKRLGASYEGTLDAAGEQATGEFSQGPGKLPLTLKKGLKAEARKRPQNPSLPLPYKAEDVTFDNKQAAGVALAGTLTIPEGKGPFPAVVLISGSGPQDRDETLMGHKPFLVLSDYLTRKGVAVLRYDDRGFAKSKGDFASSTSADFATDAAAAVDYLKTRTEIDAKRIGLAGHSEGGIIAPMVATARPDVAFVVLMAGTGVTGEQILYEQGQALAKAAGASAEAAAKSTEMQRKIFAVVSAENDNAAAAQKIKEIMGGSTASEAQAKQVTSPWFRYFLAYDPAPALAKLKAPVLAVNGELDRQVVPEQNLPAIEAALKKGGNPDFQVVKLPGLNHLLQSSKTGAVGEYAEIEETMSPAAMEVIATWIRQHTGLEKKQ